MKCKPISELLIEERPRERLLTYGVEHLHDEELLSILLGSGSKNSCVRSLAKKVLKTLDKNTQNINTKNLCKIEGIGVAKATLLVAAFEFARRRIKPKGITISSAKDLTAELQHLAKRSQEHFICASLNGAHEIIAIRIVTIGLVNSCQVHPREVLSDPLKDRAAAIIVAHNHPSGRIKPSSSDIQVTERLYKAAKLVGIPLLDHIIFSGKEFYSMNDEGDLEF